MKICRQIIGAVCVGILAYYHNRNYYLFVPDLFFLLMATSFVIGTFCLLVSCLFSLSTGGIISKTIYVSRTQTLDDDTTNEFWIFIFSTIYFYFKKELIYHSVAAILLLIATVYLLVKINDYKNTEVYDKYIIVGVSVNSQ